MEVPIMAEYKNAEGYADPTAFGAFCAIEKEEKALRAFRPIVYICSPYAGDIENNTAAARRYSRFAVEAGYIPIAPHLLFPQFLDDSNPKERELGLFFGNAILSKCAEMWVFGDRISEGMEAEIKRATWKGHRIRYFSETCEEVTQ
jgi:hypothetical protein